MTTPPSILDISSLPPQTAITKPKKWTKPTPTIPKPTSAIAMPIPTETVQTVPTRAPISSTPTSTPVLPTSQSSSEEDSDKAPLTTMSQKQQTTTRNLGKKNSVEKITITKISDTPPKSTMKPFVAGAQITEGQKLSPRTLFTTKGKWF